ncbi:MAG: hypothetical protein AAF481_04770 [Acidobacteriota bacterium]
MARTNSKSSSPAETAMTAAKYFQHVWENGLAALPGPVDLPDYLKPERIQKSLAASLAELAEVPPSKRGIGGTQEVAEALPFETLFHRIDDLPGWHVANENLAVVKGFVFADSNAAVQAAAFIAGAVQAFGIPPALTLALNTVWVVLRDPLAGGVTEATLVAAERLNEGLAQSAA